MSPFIGQRVRTPAGEMLFRGTITQCEQFSDHWRGRLPDWREIQIAGELPQTRILAAIQTSDPTTTGVYWLRRKPRKPDPTKPPSPERDAEIYEKRKAGRTLRSLAEEYGLSAQTVRTIEWRHEQREQRRAQGYGELSTRAINCMRNAINHHTDYWRDWSDEDPKTFAKKVAALSKKGIKETNNVGKKTLAEIEAFLAKYGYHFAREIDLEPSEYHEMD